MPLFRKCEMTMFAASGEWSAACELMINGDKIIVSYDDNNEKILYKGNEVEKGHYKLTCGAKRGRATLHRFEDDDVLEGYWIEEGMEGMWRLRIED